MVAANTVWLAVRFGVLFSFLLLFFGMVCVGLYDVKQARSVRKRRFRSLQTIAYTKNGYSVQQTGQQPHVTVIVPAYNEELVVNRCLDSLIQSDYMAIDIVVVNDASKDATAKMVRQFIKQHPTASIRLVDLRKNRGKGGAINYALKRYCRGELVIIIDADCTVKNNAISKAVVYFEDPAVMGVAACIRIAEDPTPLSYLQKIEYLAGYQFKKFFSITNSEFIIGGQGSTYRTDIIKQVGGLDERMLTEDIALSLSVAELGNKLHRLVYASDVITYTEAVPDVKGLYGQRYRWKFGAMQALFAHKNMIMARNRKHSLFLTWFRIPQALAGEVLLLFEPILLTLFLATVIATHSLMVFFGSWFTLITYLLFMIILDEYSTIREKAKMALILPFMYPFFYLLTLINLVAMLMCIRNWRRLFGLEAVRGTWISPQRIGKQYIN